MIASESAVRPASGSRRSGHPRFFVRAAGFCVVLVFGGFTSTYIGPMLTGSAAGFEPVVHLHGLVFFAWTLLLFVQTSLVAGGRTRLHRSVGLFGISLATLVVVSGFTVSLIANAERLRTGDASRAYALGFSNSFALVAFATLTFSAILARRNGETHKRLMLFAMCMLLAAPVGRLYRPLFASGQPSPWLVFATIDSVLLACIVQDWRTLGRPHPATVVGGSVLLASQVLRFRIPDTRWWHSTYDIVLRLVS